MKVVQVRNVPEETHAVLRRRAAEAGMSLQEFLLAHLNDFARRPTVAEVLAGAGQRAGGHFSVERVVADLRAEREAH
ncbi:MAG: hypothetical protein KY434_01485 [Actinobacteria bacterium]|nr:hypothetical protein [Actinomycetota bacterium]